MTHSTDNSSEPPVSRSERKRQATHLQKLGQRLAELKSAELDLIGLPLEAVDAIAIYKKIRSNEARRRQLQFIGKLMRRIDTEPILKALDDLDGSSASARYQFHQLEQWRDRLIEDPGSLADYLRDHPHADRQQLRHQLSRIHKARDDAQHKSATRALYQLLKQSELDPT